MQLLEGMFHVCEHLCGCCPNSPLTTEWLGKVKKRHLVNPYKPCGITLSFALNVLWKNVMKKMMASIFSAKGNQYRNQEITALILEDQVLSLPG